MRRAQIPMILIGIIGLVAASLLTGCATQTEAQGPNHIDGGDVFEDQYGRLYCNTTKLGCEGQVWQLDRDQHAAYIRLVAYDGINAANGDPIDTDANPAEIKSFMATLGDPISYKACKDCPPTQHKPIYSGGRQ